MYGNDDNGYSSGNNYGYSDGMKGHNYGNDSSYNAGGTYDYIGPDPKQEETAGTGSQRPRRKKKKSSFGKNAAKAVCLGVIFGLAASGTMFAFNKASGGKTSTAAAGSTGTVNIVQTSSSSVSTTEASGVSDIVDQVMPSIVAVNTTIQSTTTDFFGRQYTQEGSGAGSGIIISQDNNTLYIMTNNHVIADATKVSVQFSDGKSADATVKGSVEDADIAVLTVDMSSLSSDTKNAIKVAVMGDSDNLKAGESAIAIGNALGYGQSVTTGVISAAAREVQLTDKTMTLVQTSAAINPGNSGGALLNGKGEVIGVNTVKFSDTEVEGMGYAIPINDAVKTAKGIIDGTITEKTEDETPYLGIMGGTISSEAAKEYGAPEGVYVSSVEQGSAAARAGLSAGCIITKFNGTQISSMEDLQAEIEKCKPGDSVTVTAVYPNSDGSYTNAQSKDLTTIIGRKSDSSSTDSSSSGSGSQYGSGSGNGYGSGYGSGSGNGMQP